MSEPEPMSLAASTKTATKRLLYALGVGDAVLDPYRRTQRVRRARAFLESGYVFPHETEAILADFSDVCLNTQLSIAGICNLEAVARYVVERRISGAFVECGTWRGGALGYWARAFVRNGGDVTSTSVWGFDSFEGMPQMTAADGEYTAQWMHQRSLGELPAEALRGDFESTKVNLAAEDDVWRMLAGSRFPRERMHVVKGWFQDSLPKSADAIGPIAVLRLDGDFYESTRTCLEQLYDRVVPGGVIIVDDYGVFPGCRRAIDELFAERKLQVPLLYVEMGVRYFFKP